MDHRVAPALAVLVALGMGLSSLGLVGGPGISSPVRSSFPASAPQGSTTLPTTASHGTSTSLGRGESPVLRTALPCRVGLNAGCWGPGESPADRSRASDAGTPPGPVGGPSAQQGRGARGDRANGTAPGWFNVTQNISTLSSTNYATPLPTNTGGSSMAYDPLLASLVLWVGCSTTICPDRETWEYGGNGWRNLTGSLPSSPPSREFASMDYDPAWGGVVLVGGFNAGGVGLNDTWLFNGVWHNETAKAGPLRDVAGRILVGGIGADPMTWDPALQGMVMADGCSEVTCTVNLRSLTWLLNATGWHTLGVGPGSVAGTELGWGSMAYDADASDLVFFGGYDRGAGFSENYTYTYAGPGTGWVNVTTQDSGCSPSCTPGPRDGAGLTSWNHEVLMVGGYNSAAGILYNDSWTFDRGAWVPTSLLDPTPPPSAFLPVWEPALSPNSTDVSPLVVGGDTFSGAFSNEWVWEYRPAPVIVSVVPLPVDADAIVNITGAYTLGAGSGPRTYSILYFGDNLSAYTLGPVQNSSTPFEVRIGHVYAAPGTYLADLVEFDFFLLSGRSAAVPVLVGPRLWASSSASPTSLDPGQTVAFSAAAGNGTAPYNFSWDFGDASAPSNGPAVTHTYNVSGTFAARVVVTDAGGGTVVLVQNITVYGAMAVTLSASPPAPTTGQPVDLTASVQGGSGTYVFAWSFGDGSPPVAVQNTSHSYAAAGTYTVTLWVNDSLGASVRTTLVLNVTTSAPPPLFGSSPFGATGTLIILLVVLAAAVGLTVLYFWTRRRTRPSQRPPASVLPATPSGPSSPGPQAGGTADPPPPFSQ